MTCRPGQTCRICGVCHEGVKDGVCTRPSCLRATVTRLTDRNHEIAAGLSLTASRLADVALTLDQRGTNLHVVKGAIGWMRSREQSLRELLSRS